MEITEIEIQKAWDAYADSIEISHPRIFSTLKQQKPTMSDDGKILIQLNSNAQQENFIHKIKPGLSAYFKVHLADIEYEFETSMIESESTTLRKVYTDHDKLEYMIKKNKELGDMKIRFNLDFDN